MKWLRNLIVNMMFSQGELEQLDMQLNIFIDGTKKKIKILDKQLNKTKSVNKKTSILSEIFDCEDILENCYETYYKLFGVDFEDD